MPPPSLLQELVDKQDGFEIVRDQIGALLVLETANQVAKAIEAGRDSKPWALRIFSDRSSPIGEFVDFDSTRATPEPIVNVSYNGSIYEKRASNAVEQQRAESTFWIDCYVVAGSTSDGSSGHIPGDQLAARDLHRVVRLVRNYLMAGPNTYLQLPGKVGGRWLQGIDVLELPNDTQPVQHIAAARLTLQVSHQEYSPQYQGPPLELLSVNVNRAPNGELSYLTATYPGETTP